MATTFGQQSLKDLVDNFTPGGCYGIEWQLDGDMLKCKDIYNPQWRLDGVKAKGLKGLYTERSRNYEFAVGQGLVGKTFSKQEVLFVKDLQAVNEEAVRDCMQLGDGNVFLRAELVKEFDLHSAIFLPLPCGVLEVGSAAFVESLSSHFAPYIGPATPPLGEASRNEGADGVSMVAPPPVLPKLVEELSSAGSYGIEWVREGETLKYRSHYNPQWRIEGIRQQGLKGAYTTKSIGYTFASGEGFVGKAFAEQQTTFVKDVQLITPDEIQDSILTGSSEAFYRSSLAQEFGIHSVLFLPSADGVLEVGSTLIFEDLKAFLSERAVAVMAGEAGTVDISKALKGLAISEGGALKAEMVEKAEH